MSEEIPTVRDSPEASPGGGITVVKVGGSDGIDLDAATVQLETEGVEKFVTPFDSLMQSIRDQLD